MTFWETREPASSDYRHVHVSGKLDHPYRLPTAKCEKCGESIGEFDAVLPFDCPASLRKNPLFTDKDSEVPIKEFQRLAKKIVAEAGEPGAKAAKPVPGACLQPGFLDVPSLPNVDFLWSDLWSGSSSMVVSERVRSALADLHAPDTAFYKRVKP
ncbi:MAG: hypothetical protein NTX27_14350 [Verrucomicrobia bacterium]|nr:hypothetical protein [Verrucomicrobiota bacterium]